MLLLIFISALLASAAAGRVGDVPPVGPGPFNSTIELASVSDQLQPGPRVYIPSGSCSGRINQDLLCGSILPLSLSVTVSDPRNGYAHIDIADDLTGVDIVLRRNEFMNCEDVQVTLKLVCESRPTPGLLAKPVALPPVPSRK